MDVVAWVSEKWFPLLQSVGIVGGLLFAAASFRADAKARRVSNLIALTHHHREIWTQLYKRPELSRVLRRVVNLSQHPVTEEEDLFVNLLILHLNSSFRAMKDGVFVRPDGLQKDIRRFFTLPIPKAVWRQSKAIQDADFVNFIESNVSSSEKAEAG